MIRVLAIGDVMGKPGRQCLHKVLPFVRARYEPSVVIANGENAAGGCGLTRKVYDELCGKYGVDCLTMGNHWHDKAEIHTFVQASPNIVLPANMYNVSTMNLGYRVLTTAAGWSYAVINLTGKIFMYGENSCPFKAVEYIMGQIPASVKIRIVDVHGETTSEKQALAHHLAGRVSLVYGTHTHVPTADERVLEGGTGFVTDLGMTGPYDSVIGIRKEAAIQRMLTGEKKRWEPATGDPWLCGIVATIDPATGRCHAVERLRLQVSALTAELALGTH